MLYQVAREPDTAVLASRVMAMMVQWFEWCLLLPFLDGTRLFFLAIELVARRSIHPRHERWVSYAAIALQLCLAVLAFRTDYERFVS